MLFRRCSQQQLNSRQSAASLQEGLLNGDLVWRARVHGQLGLAGGVHSIYICDSRRCGRRHCDREYGGCEGGQGKDDETPNLEGGHSTTASSYNVLNRQ